MKNLKLKIIYIIGAVSIAASIFAASPQQSPMKDNENSKPNLTGGSWHNLDCNYVDHGMVNINGNKVTTKKYTFLPESWNDGAKRALSHDGSGVIIDNYLFHLDGNGVFKVKDRDSGVVKELDQKITNLQIVGNDPVYTVLKGYEYGQQYYSLLAYRVYDNIGWVDFYKFQINDAFNNGVEKIKSIKIDQWKPWSNASQAEYKIISLIRVPALLAERNSGNLGNSDFAVAMIYFGGTPSRIYYHTLNWNYGTHYDNLNDRFIDYKPWVSYSEWSTLYQCHVYWQGYLGQLDAVSGTTYIGSNGEYKVLLGINCWDRVSGGGLKKTNKSFAAMKLVNFNVIYDEYGRYKLQMTGSSNYTLVNDNDTFSEGHYAVVGTWAEAIGDSKAKQIYGFVSPFDRSDAKFYKRCWSEAYYDWSERTLAAHNVGSVTFDTSNIKKEAHDGIIVQGMVLGVPPHPELYKNIISSFVNVKSSIKSTEWNGTKSSVENTTTVEAGGCTPLVPFAGSASKMWSRENSSKDWTTFSTGSATKLDNYNENMIVGIRPFWEPKAAILKGNNGKNVRYANQPETKNAYLALTAVMDDKKSGLTVVTSSTANPGRSITGQEIIPTKGMVSYSATKNSEGDIILYNKYLKICENLENLAKKGDIREVVTTRSNLSSVVNQEIWFNIEKGQEKSCSTTNKYSIKLKTGVKDIATISNETTASIQKSYGSSVTNEDGCAFAYQYKGDKKYVSEHIEVKPVMYWIPVSELKAKYPDRISKVDLTFIPDYMWENSMDYWLMAYRIIGTVHME